MGVNPTGSRRCFAIVARYDFRLDGVWIDDFSKLYQLSAEEQAARVDINVIMCVMLRLSRIIDFVPTSSISQSFHAQHNCSILCVVTEVVCEDTFGECPRRVEKGHRRCVDDGLFYINSYRFSDPFAPIPLPSAAT